jgi:GGDEF domain-containing protein
MTTDQLPPRRTSEIDVVNGAEFRVIAGHELRRSTRDGHCLSVIWLSVDRRGPVALDEAIVERSALRAIGELLGLELRSSDVVGAVGERELAVLLPDTDTYQAEVVLDHLQATIPELSRTGPSPLVARTSSTTYEPGDEPVEVAQLFAAARGPLTRTA